MYQFNHLNCWVNYRRNLRMRKRKRTRHKRAAQLPQQHGQNCYAGVRSCKILKIEPKMVECRRCFWFEKILLFMTLDFPMGKMPQSDAKHRYLHTRKRCIRLLALQWHVAAKALAICCTRMAIRRCERSSAHVVCCSCCGGTAFVFFFIALVSTEIAAHYWWIC